ncbi:MAG: acyltransferase family protein [Flavobacterium sp.]|nr:acyltransferase family protein [Flavobacterium sp.]
MLDQNENRSLQFKHRLPWVDQVKGFTIFLVVYGHNFPFIEKYIYSFHMPLFIMVAGFFHPQIARPGDISKRFRNIMIPYFLWSAMLFLFWYVLGRKYGDSAAWDLSPIKNLIGIFYSQGDRFYMDWGIPMWFLPALFVTYLLWHVLLKIQNEIVSGIVLFAVMVIGFIYPYFTDINLPWSTNIAMVAVFFYAFGHRIFAQINNMNRRSLIIGLVAAGLLSVLLCFLNSKVDMYRAIYGNELYFILGGLTGSLFVIFFFRAFPIFGFLGFIGKFSLMILALQLLAMTFIKLVLLTVFGQTDFNFSEWERFLYAILQIILMIPAFLLVNKYVPILNGGAKKI